MSSSPDIIPPIAPGSNTIPGNNAAASKSSNSANTTSATGSNAANSLTSLAGNFTTFLNLLTTQLQHQDPSSPVDANQFTQQLVEFAGVQQQVQTNTLLQQLVTATQGNQIGSASSYIGTTIQASGNQGGLTNGQAQFGYTLSAAAASTKVSITDSTGQTVFTGTGSSNAGPNVVTWDGTNSFTGQKSPDGVYTISVASTDANGNTVTSTPFVTGTVTSASISNGSVMLNIGGLQVPAGNVTNVTNLPGVPAPSTSAQS